MVSDRNGLDDLGVNRGVEPMERSECLLLLAGEDVGRLVVMTGGNPDIFPVNYIADDDGTIVFQTATGTKLAGASGGPVLFEVDRLDRATRSGWSVVVRGETCPVAASDAARLRVRMTAGATQSWVRSEKPHMIRVVPRTVSGRRITPTLPPTTSTRDLQEK